MIQYATGVSCRGFNTKHHGAHTKGRHFQSGVAKAASFVEINLHERFILVSWLSKTIFRKKKVFAMKGLR